MNLTTRLKKAGALLLGSPFESSNQSSRRARVPGSAPTDYRHEYQGWTRLETVKKSRYLTKNSGLHREQRDLNILYGVGADGLWPKPHVSDLEWVKDATQLFREWSIRADVTNRFSFIDVQKLCSAAIDTDGEIFVVKVHNRATGECRLQLLETHRVGNFQINGDPDRYIDGIKVGPTGAPTHIRVLQNDGTGKDVRFQHVMHLFDPESPTAYRHAPAGTHGLLHGLDEIELLALEKHAVKDNSSIVRVLQTQSGELDADGDFGPDGFDSDGNTDPNKLANIVGGRTVAIYPHEKLEPYESQRPSPTFNGFLEHLRRDSSLGRSPYEFAVDPTDATGPAIRLIVAKAQRRFKSRTELLSNRLIRPTWFYVIGDAIDKGQLPAMKGWSNVSITPPREITVDAGRESEANRRDVAAGLKLPTTSYEETGQDFLDSMERRADLIKAVEAIAKIKDVDPEKLYDFTVASGAEQAIASVAGTAPSGGDSKAEGKDSKKK